MFRTLSLMRWLGCLALASVFALAACGSDKPPAAAPAPSTVDVPAGTFPKVSATSPPPATPAPPTTIDEKAAVLAAYDAYRRARVELFSNPTLDSPLIDQLTTGNERANFRANIKARIDGRYVLRAPSPSVSRHRATVIELPGTSAQLSVCSVDDTYRLYLDDGRLENQEVATSLITVYMAKEETKWKVADSLTNTRDIGIAGCALAF